MTNTTSVARQTVLRTPLRVEDDHLAIGDAQRMVVSSDNETLLLAYLDFLGELRSADPTVASLRVADLEVLSRVTGLPVGNVRIELQRFMSQRQPKPTLSRRARKRAFAACGVAVLGGALVLAATFADRPTSTSSGAVAPASVKIGTALVIERASTGLNAVHIASALTIERPDQAPPAGIEIGSALTIEN
jgi:hypothetical protein